MCLYPRIIRNPKYRANKKNGGYVPIPSDNRARWIAIGCGECIECKQKKSREWRVRLSEEFKRHPNCSFVTLTFSEENLLKYRQLAHDELDNENKLYCDIYEIDNVAAKIAIRQMLERHRKKTGKSIKHWLITERGHQNTRRIHIHGLLWERFNQEGRGKNGNYDLNKLWNNGWCFNGDYVGLKTITYISKYITKHDKDNEGFHGKIMTSAGIGKGYIYSKNVNRNRYDGKKTCTTYQLNNGKEVDLPIYYRNKIYTEREREKLWMQLLDKQERWVLGVKTDISMGLERYENLVSIGRMISQNAGYRIPEWTTEEYKKTYVEKVILLNRNNSVILQSYLNEENYAKEKTNQRCGNENGAFKFSYESSETGDVVYPSGGLFDSESLHNREEQTLRLWDETKRYRDFDKRHITRKTTYNEMRRTNPDIYTLNVNENNRSRYECIDVDTGEVFMNGLNKSKTYKTVRYEKRSRKITKPDGSRSKIWHTIRYVKEIGCEQLELFR